MLKRALADQLEGNEDQHGKYRKMVLQYILKNREMFEPFIEDEVPFEEYCQSMENDGTWAGHMELQAASLVTHCNICIHRSLSPRWYIRNFDDHEHRMIHLSYHDEEHYNSVRLKEDSCIGPARLITIKADAYPSAMTHQAKVSLAKSKGLSGKNIINEASIKVVMAGSGCDKAEEVEQVLQQLDGEVDAAIEFLVAKQHSEEDVDDNKLPHQLDTSYGSGENKNGKFVLGEEDLAESVCKQGSSVNGVETVHDENSSCHDNKKIPRNKVCPCGSKRKYKACCGSGARSSSFKSLINQTGHLDKSTKERKQAKKGGLTKSAASHGSVGGPPDMGALCI